MTIHKILCPVDFSESSGAALGLAVRLAKDAGATVTLAHVVQPSYVLAPDAGYVLRSIQDVASQEADTGLAACKADGERIAPGVPIEVVRLDGTPWDSLCRQAREGAFDLIVMGTHGRTGLAHALVGSVAERVVRHAPCPVLVTRAAAAAGPPFRQILCAVDFSEPSREALRFAAELAKQGGATLTVMHVYAKHAPADDRAVEEKVDQLRPALTEWQETARALGAPRVEVAWEEGRAWQAIVRRAAEQHHDLVVVGTHGRTGLEHVFLGSVAERVLRHAPCSVLAVRKLPG